MAAIVIASAAAPAAARADLVDWVATGPDVTNGTLLGREVLFTGPNQGGLSTVDGSATFFAGPDFTPQQARGDAAYIVVGADRTFTLSFGGPVQDPVLELASLGSTLTFAAGTIVSRVSGSPGFTVNGNTVSGTSTGGDSQGTVRLPGVYATLSFTGIPGFNPAGLDGIYLQAGGTLLAPATGTSPPGGGGPVVTGDPQQPVLRRVRNELATSWSWSRRATRANRLTVERLRPGMSVRVACAGKGCAIGTKTIAVQPAQRRLELAGLLRHRWLTPGTTLRIVIARPGRIAKVVTYTVRRGKRPRVAKRCLPPGAAKPARCQSRVARITSDALMIATTSVPSVSPSSCAASVVIEATSRWPPTSSATVVVAGPSVVSVTVAASWLRALSFMLSPPGPSERDEPDGLAAAKTA